MLEGAFAICGTFYQQDTFCLFSDECKRCLSELYVPGRINTGIVHRQNWNRAIMQISETSSGSRQFNVFAQGVLVIIHCPEKVTSKA